MSPSPTSRIAFVGTGGRAVPYATEYAKTPGVEIVAIADPNPENRQKFKQNSGIQDRCSEYDDWHDMLERHRNLNGVVISSPNHTHADPTVACLEQGLPVALEKPLAANKADCERILDAVDRFNGRTLIGFVLRSAPFYRTIKQIIDSGTIGRLLTVQADEMVSWTVTSLMCRSPWRRYGEKSGGLMLEKSCHDIDLLNWIIGSRPVALDSFGGQRFFRANSALPETCDGCGIANECLYFNGSEYRGHEDQGERLMHKFLEASDACIFNIDKDIVDVQNVAIEYENGVLANFMLSLHCGGPRAGRNFFATGTKGNVWGHFEEGKLHLFDYLSGRQTMHEIATDGSGHGGADRSHALELLRMIREPEYRPIQDAATGYLSAVTCFAADTARTRGHRAHLVYQHGNRIEIQA